MNNKAEKLLFYYHMLHPGTARSTRRKSYAVLLKRRNLSTAVRCRHLWEATSAFGMTYEETWENMPAGAELQSQLEALGIYDKGLSEEKAQQRFARFQGTEFGVAPRECWSMLRRDLLEFEEMCAYD